MILEVPARRVVDREHDASRVVAIYLIGITGNRWLPCKAEMELRTPIAAQALALQ